MADKNSESQSGATSGEGDENTPKYITQAELDKTVSGFRGRFMKDLEKLLESRLSNTKTEVEEETEEVEDKRPTMKKLDAETLKLKNQVAALMKEKETRDAADKAKNLKDSLRDALLSAGISEKSLNHAIKYLKDDVYYNEDGDLSIKFNNNDYELSEGLANWVKSDDAKYYIPPKGTKGSGTQGKVVATTIKTTEPEDPREMMRRIITGGTQ